MNGALLRAAVILAMVLASRPAGAAGQATGQEPPTGQARPPAHDVEGESESRPGDDDGRRIQHLSFPSGTILVERDGESYRATITGGFTLRWAGKSLQGRGAVLWLDARTGTSVASRARAPADGFSGELLQEVYAEGDILYEDGLETMEASEIYLDLERAQGLIIEATLRSRTARVGRVDQVVVRAAQIRQEAERRFVGLDARITSCVFGHPHYHIRSDEIVYTRDAGASSGTIDARGNRLVLDETGLLPLPSVRFRTDEEPPLPIRSLRVGRSSKLGAFLLSRWGAGFQDPGRSVNRALGIDGEFQGDWFADVNEYTERGLGLGGGLEWRTEKAYFGGLEIFYLHDSADEDGDGTPIAKDDRGRVKFYDRAWLGRGWRLDTELSHLSDGGFLREYYEKEAEEEKEQETYAYLRKLWTRQGLTFLSRHRLNAFDTQTEYTPRVAFRSIGEPLAALAAGSRVFLYHTNFSEVSNVRRLASSDLEGTPEDFPSERLTRADTVDRFDLPFEIGPYSLTSFYENRLSYFERSFEHSHPAWRYAGTAGISLQTQLHRSFDTKSDLLGIDGLRHIVIPEIQYRNSFEVTDSPDSLIPIDEIETPKESEVVLFRLDQRFQTHRDEETFDFLAFELEQPVYPDEERDNLGELYGPLHVDSLLSTDIQGYPFKKIAFSTEGFWNWQEDSFDRLNLAVSSEVAPRFLARSSYRVRRGLFRVLTAGVLYQLTPKWQIDLLEQRDLMASELLERRVTLRRFAHDWILELSYAVDAGENNHAITLAVAPLALWRQQPDRVWRRFSEPRFDPLVEP